MWSIDHMSGKKRRRVSSIFGRSMRGFFGKTVALDEEKCAAAHRFRPNKKVTSKGVTFPTAMCYD